MLPGSPTASGYTAAFTVSAALFGLGVLLAIVLLPSKQRLDQLMRNAAAAPGAASADSAAAGQDAAAGRPGLELR